MHLFIQIAQIRTDEKQTYPEAQFPATAPERSWHSEEVRQVPFRLAPFLNDKKI